MQTEERSICPSCGGDNPQGAAFCWRCYASMPTTSTARGGVAERGDIPSFARPGLPGMPAPPSMPLPPDTGSGPSALARVLVGAAAALIAMFGVRAVLDRGPSLPNVLAGTPRITTQAVKDFEKQMVDDGKRSGLDVAAGAYGSGAVPTFVVLLVDGRSVEATDDIFSQFVDGMASGGATVDANATVRGEHAGLEYRCVPVVAPQIEAAACMWRDGDTVGVVFRLDGGIDATKDLLFRTHDELA
jgi:hypothetical protein